MKWLPKILSLLCLWASVAYVVLYVEPQLLRDVLIPGLYLPFFGLVTLSLWYTIALFIRSFGKSLLLTLTLVAGLVLSTLKLMFWGLGLVFLLTLVIESWYIYHSYEKTQARHEPKNRNTSV